MHVYETNRLVHLPTDNRKGNFSPLEEKIVYIYLEPVFFLSVYSVVNSRSILFSRIHTPSGR